MAKKIDLSGRIYSRVLVLSSAGTCHTVGGASKAIWNCRCECGRGFLARGSALTQGRTKSCGCWNLDCLKSRRFGVKKPRKVVSEVYQSWCSAKGRCNNPNNPKFPAYGGRGIKMCERWSKSFTAFKLDMGNRPEGHTLERLDVNGWYCKENCIWATVQVQNENRRNASWLNFNGQEMKLVDVARKTGIKAGTLRMRIVQGVDLGRGTNAIIQLARHTTLIQP